MSCCIFGVCIPYNVLLPVVIVFLKQIYDFCMKLIGRGKGNSNGDDLVKDKANVVTATSNCCCNDNSNKNNDSNMKQMIMIQLNKNEHFYLDDSMNFKSILSCTDKILYIRFTATWCKPCKQIEPFFIDLSSKYKDTAHFISIDIDNHDNIQQEYRVIGIPLFIAIKNGKEINRYSGSSTEALQKFIN